MHGDSNWFRVLSPEVQVHWAGWHSTLAELHRNKWEISVEEGHPHDYRRRYRVFMRHQGLDCAGYGEFPDEILQYLRPGRERVLGLHLDVNVRIQQNINMQGIRPPDLALTHPINPITTYTDEPMVSLKDCKIFRDADPVQPEHEVIVREPTMMEILEMALEKQEPEQQRIREERIQRNSKLKAHLRMVV